MKMHKESLLIALFALLCALSWSSPSEAAQGYKQGCSAFKPCKKGLTCHPMLHKCFHYPRRVGEPCAPPDAISRGRYTCGHGLYCHQKPGFVRFAIWKWTCVYKCRLGQRKCVGGKAWFCDRFANGSGTFWNKGGSCNCKVGGSTYKQGKKYCRSGKRYICDVGKAKRLSGPCKCRVGGKNYNYAQRFCYKNTLYTCNGENVLWKISACACKHGGKTYKIKASRCYSNAKYICSISGGKMKWQRKGACMCRQGNKRYRPKQKVCRNGKVYICLNGTFRVDPKSILRPPVCGWKKRPTRVKLSLPGGTCYTYVCK